RELIPRGHALEVRSLQAFRNAKIGCSRNDASHPEAQQQRASAKERLDKQDQYWKKQSPVALRTSLRAISPLRSEGIPDAFSRIAKRPTLGTDSSAVCSQTGKDSQER